MKKQLLTTLLAALACTAGAFETHKWNIDLNEQTRRLSVSCEGSTLMSEAYAEARLGDDTLRSYNAQQVLASVTATDDNFGQGTVYEYRYDMGGGTWMVQTFAFYDDKPYMVTRLALTTASGPTQSNYLVPLKSRQQATFMPQDTKNRMLFVPWDNDGFIRYGSRALRGTLDSYSATAIYNTATRRGLVAGAVDHDLWKSAIHVEAAEGSRIDELALISGYTDEHSHDTIQVEGISMPHGAVVADTVRSARFMVGWFADWRQGMDTFGQACTLVAPKREWEGGAPYGWSSWGVQSTDISYQGVIDCADFIRDNLVAHGFHDKQGRVVLSLDAWWNDNLSTQQVKDFVAYCKENNMIPGLYYGSFCRFGDLQSFVPGTNNKYRFRDIALKQHGRYKVVDGAYCLDPTHVGTKQFMMNDMVKFKSWGIEYLKCDFMSNGAIEADSWYNPNCHTGIQAYNEGMAYLMKQAGTIYLDLSISPAFPYQYTHGRRISCDAWGALDHTVYVMNNASYGWWLQQLYVANDPDHMVMVMRQEAGGAQTEGANRARITSGAVVGAFLTGDNFSPNVTFHDSEGKTRPNYYATSQERALKLLTNDDVNEIPRTCQSFRPVYGNASSNVGAETLMTYENEKYVYVAAFNYQGLMPISGQVPFADLDVNAADVSTVKELWTGDNISTTATGFQYSVPAGDARIYRLQKSGEAGISSTVRPAAAAEQCYDLQGRRVSTPQRGGIYVMRQEGKTVKKLQR